MVRNPQRRGTGQRWSRRRTPRGARSVAALPVLVGYRDIPPPPDARTQNSARGAAISCAVCVRSATSRDSIVRRRQDGKRSLVRGAGSCCRQALRRASPPIEARRADMKRHKWTDIKARTKPETRRRLEADAQRLSEDLHLSQLRKA